MPQTKKITRPLVILAGMLLNIPAVSAASVNCTANPNDLLCSPVNLLISPTDPNRQTYLDRIRSGGIQEIFNHITSLFASGAAVFAVVALIYGAFLLVTAHGNEEQITKAKQFITLTIMGLVLLTLTYVIVITLRDILYGPPTF